MCDVLETVVTTDPVGPADEADVLAARALMAMAVPGAGAGAGPSVVTTTTTASGMAATAEATERAGAAAARRSLTRAHVGDTLRRCAAAVEPVTSPSKDRRSHQVMTRGCSGQPSGLERRRRSARRSSAPA